MANATRVCCSKIRGANHLRSLSWCRTWFQMFLGHNVSGWIVFAQAFLFSPCVLSVSSMIMPLPSDPVTGLKNPNTKTCVPTSNSEKSWVQCILWVGCACMAEGSALWGAGNVWTETSTSVAILSKVITHLNARSCASICQWPNCWLCMYATTLLAQSCRGCFRFRDFRAPVGFQSSTRLSHRFGGKFALFTFARPSQRLRCCEGHGVTQLYKPKWARQNCT